MGTTTFVWDPVFDCVSHELDAQEQSKPATRTNPSSTAESSVSTETAPPAPSTPTPSAELDTSMTPATDLHAPR